MVGSRKLFKRERRSALAHKTIMALKLQKPMKWQPAYRISLEMYKDEIVEKRQRKARLYIGVQKKF